MVIGLQLGANYGDGTGGSVEGTTVDGARILRVTVPVLRSRLTIAAAHRLPDFTRPFSAEVFDDHDRILGCRRPAQRPPSQRPTGGDRAWHRAMSAQTRVGGIEVGLRLLVMACGGGTSPYRLSPNPPDLSNPARIKYPLAQHDAAAALAWLLRNAPTFQGDTRNLFFFGHYAGAHLVAIVSTDATLGSGRMATRPSW